jgi:pyridoxal phosphate enzyme (YggS family)
VDRERIATRLSDQRQTWRAERADRPPLVVLLQVNVSGEPSKSGCEPDAALALAEKVATLPGLTLRGLMAIPEATGDSALSGRRSPRSAKLHRRIADALQLPGFDVLSMGMSADLDAAIAEGATLVRVGTALFGTRPGGGPG